jgi:hypothetical protein
MEKTKCKWAGCPRLVVNEYCYWHDKNNLDRKVKPTTSNS